MILLYFVRNVGGADKTLNTRNRSVSQTEEFNKNIKI